MNQSWNRLHDFVAEVGESRDLAEFTERALAGIGHLIPYDANAMFVDADRSGRVVSWRSVTDTGPWLARFNEYYWSRMPRIDQEMLAVDWERYGNHEYVQDFIRPQGVRFSLGLFQASNGQGGGTALTLHRSADGKPFNDRELLLSRVLRPHLFNLHNLYAKLRAASSACPGPQDVADRLGGLTRREAEVAALLCCRVHTDTIASKLMISRLTVYKHIENIFRKLSVNSREELIGRYEAEAAGW